MLPPPFIQNPGMLAKNNKRCQQMKEILHLIPEMASKKIGPWISCTSKKLKEVRIMLFTCSLTEPEWEEFRWTIVQWPNNSSHGTAGSIGDVNVPRVTSTSPKLLLLLSLPYLFWPYDLYLTVIYVRIFKIWNFSLQVHGKYFWYLVYRCSFSGSTKNIILAHWW